MWALRNIPRHSLKIIPLIQSHQSLHWKDVFPLSQASIMNKCRAQQEGLSSSIVSLGCLDGSRSMSTSKGRSMRSKVENRMRRETGKTLREIRRAKKLRKKLMTDEERLIYSLRRAKKKVALLLQKLKKYELPELPPPRHDPELLTTEQLQAYKKIGFRNRNYCELGVRGVFGGVILNMHMHWKYHETVQVFCDNCPKEKIKEVATMLARLSGGVVVNIHNVKTIIMFRGRNYRTPKSLVPFNTLTKRKALFKARFEQALESQKLNIKKLEQQLRRMGVNPEDPVAMASIQRVASTFFRAIDEQQGTPYVFPENKEPVARSRLREEPDPPSEDSDQEELDRFIEEIEGAADQEWAEEEAKEKEEMNKMIRYWNGRRRWLGGEDSGDETRGQSELRGLRRDGGAVFQSEGDEFDSDEEGGIPILESDEDGSESDSDELEMSRRVTTKDRLANSLGSGRDKFRGRNVPVDSEDELGRADYVKMSDSRGAKQKSFDYYSSSDED